jgi:hypothetical protein
MLIIQSCIKGSILVLDSRDGHLTNEQYLETTNRFSTLASNDRVKIFPCFEEYERMKEKNSAWDLNDVTFYIYQQLRLGQCSIDVSHIYLDEVQGIIIF